MIKSLATFTLGIASLAASSAALAKNVDSAHMELGKAIVSTGVTFRINPPQCFDQSQTMGWYWSEQNELAVCQQARTQVNTETYWTAEDFDTLRHEAHHLVQDCIDGYFNNDLGSIYKEPIGLGKEVLGVPGMQAIAKAYEAQGPHVVVLEIEAFSVARMNQPLDQVEDIKNYCL